MAHEYAQTIWNYLNNKIGNKYGVAGLMGNLQAESELCPYRVEGDFSSGYTTSKAYTEKVDNGTISEYDFVNSGGINPNLKGYGLAQWTYYSRKQNLYDRWKSGGYSSIGSIDLALDYLWWELNNSYPAVLTVLKNAKSVREASDKVLHGFENPADQSEAVEIKRAEMGQAWYDEFAGSVSFTPRTTAPASDNKYYIHTSFGGVNECILRNSETGSVLPNCVGYAWGRAYEITGKRPTLSLNNAERWWNESSGYERGNTPKLGAVMCWSRGVVGDGSDGAGHVAIVEKINDDGSIVTSNSDYSGSEFYLRNFPAGDYTLGTSYDFQGFIYVLDNAVAPDEPPAPPVTIKKKSLPLLLMYMATKGN